MDILKISILGILAVFFAVVLKSYRPEYSQFISIAVFICIFLFAVTKLEQIVEYAGKMQDMIHLDGAYMGMVLKMIGVTYIAEFAANICKDSGYQTVAGQIELFAKLSILVLGMPVILGFMETIGELL